MMFFSGFYPRSQVLLPQYLRHGCQPVGLSHGYFQRSCGQRREAAYTEIIDALYDLIEYAELKASDYLESRHEENPKLNEFEERYNDAYWKIRRATDIGALFISEKAAEALQDLRNRPRLRWEENPAWEIYEAEQEYYKQALERVRDCAIRDLRSNKT